MTTSLHFPNFLSFLFTGEKYSGYTSIGCHTSLWDFQSNRYHRWVYDESLEHLLAPISSADFYIETEIKDKIVRVGTGIHDSSAALIPYLQGEDSPFILLSTGTWNICMNFFNDAAITVDELQKDCLNFLSTNGLKIKASRLFMGAVFKEKTKMLESFFGVEEGSYKEIAFDFDKFSDVRQADRNRFDLRQLNSEVLGFETPETDEIEWFDSFSTAYHRLIYELTTLQVESIKLAIGPSKISKIYIDGGFTHNEVFLQTLFHRMESFTIYTTDFSLGTALGACMVMHRRIPYTDFLQSKYKVKQVRSKDLPVD